MELTYLQAQCESGEGGKKDLKRGQRRTRSQSPRASHHLNMICLIPAKTVEVQKQRLRKPHFDQAGTQSLKTELSVWFGLMRKCPPPPPEHQGTPSLFSRTSVSPFRVL